MTGQPVCQWCGQPPVGTPRWWDGRPQCEDVFACQQRAVDQSGHSEGAAGV